MQEYLYEKYSRALFGAISRIIIVRDIAEEVYHDAFIKIINKIDNFDKGPVGIGLIDSANILWLQSMNSGSSAQAFAITIAPKGGSENPTLKKLVVLGEVS